MLRKVNGVVILIAMTLSSPGIGSTIAQDKKGSPPKGVEEEKSPSTAKTEKQATNKSAYLGVTVQPLHSAFWAQLSDILEHKQGLLIAVVNKNSPAEAAGLQPHDILMAFDGQKLFSPHQLVSLVKNDKVGRVVKLDIIRASKAETVKVTLGEVSTAPKTEADKSPRVAKHPWERFDSISIKSLGNGKFTVAIEYETKEGKMAHHSFEGTVEAIRADIAAQKDLPEDERDDLLAALNLREPTDLLMPHAFVTPDGRIYWDLWNFEQL